MAALLLAIAIWLSAFASSEAARKFAAMRTEHGTNNMGNRCEKIAVQFCKDMPYNMTRMPNLLGHETMADAESSVMQFQPLVDIGCSKHLRFFLCSLYAPMCSEQVDVPIPSCFSICEEVRSRCEPVLNEFHLSWPEALNCSHLPVHSKDELCMEFPNITEERAGGGAVRRLSPGWRPPSPTAGRAVPRESGVTAPGPLDRWLCPSKYVVVGGYPPYRNACAPACDSDVYFSRSDKRFAEVWMTVWSVLCFVSTGVTAFTFFLDRATFKARFRYLERPILFLSLCYLAYSCGFILAVALGRDVVSCDRSEPPSRPFLILEGLESTGCTVVFLFLYYFSTVACIWWVNLTVAWYLTSGCGWQRESVEALGTYFHLAAWVIPAILTIVVLTLRRVVGDELTGLCFVGGKDSPATVIFVVVPFTVLLLVGSVFLALGFAAMVRMRRTARGGFKSEKLMVRIGVFAGLYTVPTLILTATYVYEYVKRKEWDEAAFKEAILCDNGEGCELKSSIPNVEVFMLKVFASLVAGITSGMWVWSAKTVEAWRRVCCHVGKSRRNKVVLPLASRTEANSSTAAGALAVHRPLISPEGRRERTRGHSVSRMPILTQV